MQPARELGHAAAANCHHRHVRRLALLRPLRDPQQVPPDARKVWPRHPYFRSPFCRRLADRRRALPHLPRRLRRALGDVLDAPRSSCPPSRAVRSLFHTLRTTSKHVYSTRGYSSPQKLARRRTRRGTSTRGRGSGLPVPAAQSGAGGRSPVRDLAALSQDARSHRGFGEPGRFCRRSPIGRARECPDEVGRPVALLAVLRKPTCACKAASAAFRKPRVCTNRRCSSIHCGGASASRRCGARVRSWPPGLPSGPRTRRPTRGTQGGFSLSPKPDRSGA